MHVFQFEYHVPFIQCKGLTRKLQGLMYKNNEVIKKFICVVWVMVWVSLQSFHTSPIDDCRELHSRISVTAFRY